MKGAAPDRPPVFSALIVAGALITGVVALAGRNPVTQAVVAAYLVLLPLAILGQALGGTE